MRWSSVESSKGRIMKKRALFIYAIALLALFLNVGRTVIGDVVVATVPVGNTPVAVAVNPVNNKIYVANADSSSVTVIDGADNSTVNITTGSNPISIGIN